MSDQATAIHAVNYSVVMGLLGYSQSQLEKFADRFDSLIFRSDFVSKSDLKGALGVSDLQVDQIVSEVKKAFQAVKLKDIDTLTIRQSLYPELLRKIKRPPQVLFTRGDLELLQSDCVSVVGAREASKEGILRAQKVAIALTEAGYTIVSGLAKGIDTAAHTATLKAGGKTIGVIGTAIDQYYPRENMGLQNQIAENNLLISQFPLQQPSSKYNFPQRNLTMCGLSVATVVVEASETSGALYQAKACIEEGRTLFIMESLLERKDLTWPTKYVNKGGIVLRDIETLLDELNRAKTGKTEHDGQLGLFGTAVS